MLCNLCSSITRIVAKLRIQTVFAYTVQALCVKFHPKKAFYDHLR